MQNPVGVLTPAYGRDYKSLASMQADFDAGKDFLLNYMGGDTYCSKQDFKGKGKIQCRYARMTKVGFLKF